MVIILKTRDTNIELLRIFSMFLIMLHHICYSALWFGSDVSESGIYFFSKAFFCWPGQVGNYIFMIISGYYLCNTNVTIKKWFNIWGQIWITSVIIGCFLYILKIPIVTDDYLYFKVGFVNSAKPMDIKHLLKSFFPNYFFHNWYATTYLIFYTLVPLLNLLVKNMNYKLHLYAIIVCILLCNIFPFFPGQKFFIVNPLLAFISSYFIGSFIRIYNPGFLTSKKNDLIVIAILFIVMGVLQIIPLFVKGYSFTILGKRYEIEKLWAFINRNSYEPFLFLITAVYIFSFFRQLNLQNNKIINFFAKSCLGIYLIHGNRYLDKVIWHKIFRYDYFINKPYIYIYSFH